MALKDVPLMSGGNFISGHAQEFSERRLEFLARIAREVRDIARIRVPTRDLLIVNSPETLHQVLVSEAKSFEKSPLIRLALDPAHDGGDGETEDEIDQRPRGEGLDGLGGVGLDLARLERQLGHADGEGH